MWPGDRPLSEILSGYNSDAPLAHASTLSGDFYTDPRVFHLERRTVFSRSWIAVGHTEEVAQPGQYLTCQVGGESVLVVRGEDGILRAFFNVCRHHAAHVLTQPCGRVERLKCPYHGWVYRLDGTFQSAPELHGTQQFDPLQNGLLPVAVDTWEKFVFVHLDPNPEPLQSFLGGLVQSVAPLNFSGLHFYERRSWDIACNWKVFVDNYLDGGYHIPFLHQGLSAILPFKAYTIETFDRVCLQKSPIDPSGGDAVTVGVRRGEAQYYWLYPNFMLNWYRGYLDTNLVIPLSENRMRVVFDFYFDDTSPAAAERNRASMAVSERIQDEDHAICESVQRNLSSRAYGAGRLIARREAGEHLFHRLLVADLRNAVAANSHLPIAPSNAAG